jgi:hypothetical protein
MIILIYYRLIPLPPDGDSGIQDNDYDDLRRRPRRVSVGSSGMIVQ